MQSYATASLREQEDQKNQLQAKFDEMKKEVLAQGGDVTKMELPDIVITTDLTFTAATGTATVDRAKPLPRPLVSTSARREPQVVVFLVKNITVLLQYRLVINIYKTYSDVSICSLRASRPSYYNPLSNTDDAKIDVRSRTLFVAQLMG